MGHDRVASGTDLSIGTPVVPAFVFLIYHSSFKNGVQSQKRGAWTRDVAKVGTMGHHFVKGGTVSA